MSLSLRKPGQAMVEFAVALPVFLLLLLAVIDFGRLLFTYIGLADATREMARTAAISRSANASVVAAFNNYILFTDSLNPATDSVQVTVADESCVSDLRQGFTCSPDAVASVTCALPLQPTCAIPSRISAGGGYVEINVKYSFAFNPLFVGVGGASFIQPFSVLKTSERAYLE